MIMVEVFLFQYKQERTETRKLRFHVVLVGQKVWCTLQKQAMKFN